MSRSNKHKPQDAVAVGSTMEQYPEQGYETMVVNGLIDPTKNWGIAVADKDYQEDESLR